MLGYIFIFFIGYYFYRLAEDYSKNKWVFAILGIVGYYVVSFIFSIIYMFFSEQNVTSGFNTIALISVCVGVVFCILLYHYLDYRWKKEEEYVDDKSIDEIGKKE